MPLDATELDSYVRDSVQGVGSVITGLTAQTQNFDALRARYKLGIRTPFVVLGANIYPAALKALGPAANGIFVTSYFPPPTSRLDGERRYVRSMQQAGYSQYLGDYSQMGWVAFALFDEAAHGLKTFTRQTMLNALRHVTDFTADGLTPPLDFSRAAPDPAYPRIFNWSYFPAKVSSGRLVAAGNGRLVPIKPDVPLPTG